MQEKLQREPVEDFRIDFEDGYGNRPDEEEDGHAESAAAEVAKGMEASTLPPFIGIRIKPFNEELRARSIRTLDIFVSTLLEKAGGKLPENFVVTLPKITIPEQVTALADIFDYSKTNWTSGRLSQDGNDDRNDAVDHQRWARSICRCCCRPRAVVVSPRISGLTITLPVAASPPHIST